MRFQKDFCAIDQNFVDICHRECMTVQCLSINLTKLAFYHIAIDHDYVVDLMRKKNNFTLFLSFRYADMLSIVEEEKRSRSQVNFKLQ